MGTTIIGRPSQTPSWQLGLEGPVGVFQPRPGLGDMIWHLPHVRAIAAATGRRAITLIAKPSSQADMLLAGDPAIERIVWLDRNPRQGRGAHDGASGYRRLVADLRACGLRSCILLHHSPSLAAAMRLAGIPNRYGYGYTAAQRLWLNRPPFLTHVPATEAFEQATAYTDAAGLRDLSEPELAMPDTAALELARWLTAMEGPLAVLGVGANGVVRQWGAAKFAALAEHLLLHGFSRVLLLAAAHEEPMAQAILEALPARDRVHPAIGWPLHAVTALLATSDLFVGNDSGLMNLRAALGRPAYGLFGASGPLRHGRQIRAIVPEGGARAGMDRITVEQVIGAVGRDLRA
jgi:heptosyltransferase-2